MNRAKRVKLAPLIVKVNDGDRQNRTSFLSSKRKLKRKSVKHWSANGKIESRQLGITGGKSTQNKKVHLNKFSEQLLLGS